MRIYFAGPLFSAAERDWNVALTSALRAAGHEVFLPQEQEPGKDAAGIFATDVGGIDWADGLVAIMDGADPDSGTCWEVGYAYGKKPIVLVGRTCGGTRGAVVPATTRCSRRPRRSGSMRLPRPIDRIVREVLAALARLESADR
jgi:nucleoside 2-deoxyribosyltransferase